MLIDATYFIGEINLPGLSQAANVENLLTFIKKYEKKFLQQLLGEDLYLELIAGLGEQPIDPIWEALRDLLVNSEDKESPIANYVYYFYTRDAATQTVGVGEVQSKGENAIIASPVPKQVRAWNEMVDFVKAFDLDSAIYPLWKKLHYPYEHECHEVEIFYKINSLGL